MKGWRAGRNFFDQAQHLKIYLFKKIHAG